MGRGPDRAKREFWKRRMREFERGDEPIAQFCDREGVSRTSFYRWRRELSSAQRSGPAPRATSGVAASQRQFLPIAITPAPEPRPTAPAASEARIEVRLPGGVRVLVPCDSPAAIRTVIAALVDGAREEPAC
jgi:transposase-like protein